MTILIIGLPTQLFGDWMDFSGLKQRLVSGFLAAFAVKSDTIVEKKTI